MKEGIYLHIPFCVRKCPYCDFYSLPKQEELMEMYTKKTISLIQSCPFDLEPDTYYFGGGTPSLLGHERLIRLLNALEARFGDNKAEVTLEANPGTVELGGLLALRKAGFNRISLGMQSGREEELELLGRIHSLPQSVEAYRSCQKAGFDNISLDLMMGLPNQSVEEAISSAAALVELDPEHISAYLLKLEEGTAFSRQFTMGEDAQDLQAEIYTHVSDFLQGAGYHRYEISNFAKKGREALHNTKYWRLNDYLGIGPSAHSLLNGKRYFMASSLEEYLQGEAVWDLLHEDGEGGGFDEFVMLGLRMTEGISLRELEERYPNKKDELVKRAQPMIKSGMIQMKDERLSLLGSGFLISNAIISRLI